MGSKQYSELISYILVVEQHNDLLMKNNENWPTGYISFLEVNETIFHQFKHGEGHDRGRGRNFSHGDLLVPNNDLHYQ